MWFLSSICGYLLLPGYVRETVFPPLPDFVKNQMSTVGWLCFWFFCFSLHWCMTFVSMWVSCVFVVWLAGGMWLVSPWLCSAIEVGYSDIYFWHCFFPHMNVLATWGLFVSIWIFKIVFLVYKKCHWNFDRDCFEYVSLSGTWPFSWH